MPDIKILKSCANDPTFLKKLSKIKQANKRAQLEFVHKMTGAKVTEDKMIIAHIKRPTEHKRHYLSLIGVVDAWLRSDSSAFTIYAGKASSDCPEEKRII